MSPVVLTAQVKPDRVILSFNIEQNNNFKKMGGTCHDVSLSLCWEPEEEPDTLSGISEKVISEL